MPFNVTDRKPSAKQASALSRLAALFAGSKKGKSGRDDDDDDNDLPRPNATVPSRRLRPSNGFSFGFGPVGIALV